MVGVIFSVLHTGVTKHRSASPRASHAPRRNTCLGFNWVNIYKAAATPNASKTAWYR